MTAIDEGGVTRPHAALRELSGPPAVGSDRRRFLRLLLRMTKTDWMVRYQSSVLGYSWTLVGPLIYGVVLYIGFSRVLRFGGDIPHYQAILILNVMLFSGFTEGIGRGLSCMVSRGNLLRQIEVPRLALPLAALGTALVTLCLNIVAVLGIALVLGVTPTLTWLLLPVLIVGLAVIMTPAATLLSVINARFRDVSQVWTAVSRALFFASPVVIPIESYPQAWNAVLQWNPLAVVLAQARVWIIDPGGTSWGEAVGGWGYIVCPIVVVLGISALAVWVFRTQAGRVAEEI